MFRLEVFYNKHWKWGVVTYNTHEEAERRIDELAKVGIRARIRNNADLFKSE